MADPNIRGLAPKERIQALRELREKKKQELEELEKKSKEEMKEAEEMIKESLDDLARDEEEEEQRRLRVLKEQLAALDEEEQTLEETVAEEEIIAGKDNGQYRIPQEQQNDGGYTPLGTIVDDLNRLQYSNQWGSQEESLYQQRKEELSQTNQYRQTMGEALREELDTAQGILKKLGYKGDTV